VLKFLNFQKPFNLLMKICNGHIFFEINYIFEVSISKNKNQFRRIRTVVSHWIIILGVLHKWRPTLWGRIICHCVPLPCKRKIFVRKFCDWCRKGSKNLMFDMTSFMNGPRHKHLYTFFGKVEYKILFFKFVLNFLWKYLIMTPVGF